MHIYNLFDYININKFKNLIDFEINFYLFIWAGTHW